MLLRRTVATYEGTTFDDIDDPLRQDGAGDQAIDTVVGDLDAAQLQRAVLIPGTHGRRPSLIGQRRPSASAFQAR
jgi:uncharacterized protein